MGLQTVDRAVAVLHLLSANGPGGMRLVDVQGKLKLSKPTAHRLLAMLQYRGYVQQDPTRAYEAGPVLRQIGVAALRQPNLCEVSRPVLERLHDEFEARSAAQWRLPGQEAAHDRHRRPAQHQAHRARPAAASRPEFPLNDRRQRGRRLRQERELVDDDECGLITQAAEHVRYRVVPVPERCTDECAGMP